MKQNNDIYGTGMATIDLVCYDELKWLYRVFILHV